MCVLRSSRSTCSAWIMVRRPVLFMYRSSWRWKMAQMMNDRWARWEHAEDSIRHLDLSVRNVRKNTISIYASPDVNLFFNVPAYCHEITANSPQYRSIVLLITYFIQNCRLFFIAFLHYTGPNPLPSPPVIFGGGERCTVKMEFTASRWPAVKSE